MKILNPVSLVELSVQEILTLSQATPTKVPLLSTRGGPTGGLGAVGGALQEALEPLQEPLHDQVQGPEPETALALPALQRLEEGAEDEATPLAEPQTPLTGLFALLQ